MMMMMMMIMIMIMIMIIIIIYPENSTVGDSKDTKESTVHVRRRKRETWDTW